MATIDLTKYKQQKLDLQIEAEAKILAEAEKEFEQRSPSYKGQLVATNAGKSRPINVFRLGTQVQLGMGGVDAVLLAGTPV